jgi:hypothetical protein
MATIYSLPEDFDPPDMIFTDGRYDHAATDAAHDVWLDRLRAEAARCGITGELVGEVVRFQIADGYAQYMVWTEKPLALVHLPIYDAWSIPTAHARGLRLTDIRAMVQRENNLRAIFAATKKS